MKRPPKRLIFTLSLALLSTASACGKKSATEPAPSKDPVQIQYQRWLEMREKAVPELIEAMKSPEWRVRSHAVLAMGQSGVPALESEILARLEDENLAVRNSAVIALGDLQAPGGVKGLVQIIAPGKNLPANRRAEKRLAIEALGKIGKPATSAVPELAEIVLSGDDAQALAAVEALALIGDTRASKYLLARRDRFMKNDAARHVAALLGRLPVPGSEETLLGFLSASDTQLRIAAIVSLGAIKSRRATGEIIRQMDAPESLAQKQAAAALVAIDDPAAVRPLIQKFDAAGEAVPMAAAYVLSSMTTPTIAEEVLRFFKARSDRNAPAAYVLGRKKHKAASPSLQERLGDARQNGANEMAEALGYLGEQNAVPLLIKITRRNVKEGAIGAVTALGVLKAKEAVPTLISLLDAKEEQLVNASASALGEIGDSTAVKPLIELSYRSGARYARTVGLALGKIGGAEVREFVKDNIGGKEVERVMAAGTALVRGKDPELLGTALKLIAEPDAPGAKFALQYLQKLSGKDFRTVREWKEWGARNIK